jgi:predicted DNA-binding protein (MmcQ/YjbR family)
VDSARLTPTEVRAFALSLPEATESSHFGTPDFRVRNRIFATLPEGANRVNLKTTPLVLDMLVRHGDGRYTAVWGGRWLSVDLARVSAGEVRELVLESYCLTSTKKLATLAREEKNSEG